MEEMKDSTPSTSSREEKGPRFNLLLDNLEILEKTVADSDALRLEKDILLQLGRLGALKLFDTCLSRTLETSNIFDLSDVHTEPIIEYNTNSINRNDNGEHTVSSGKKGQRKLRRKRALVNATKGYSRSLPSETIQKDIQWSSTSSLRRTSKSKTRRSMIARNEAELSKGVKLVAELERIRMRLEEQTGRVSSLSCWAEAAGVDEKVLQQDLRFGWYCRDELFRSTRGLILYLARHYRGKGIAVEDLLQAGYLGVLQGAERFDHKRGCKFSTYVQYWVRKYMSRMVAQYSRGIQIPYALNGKINQIQLARKFLKNSHGRHADDIEIAKHTGLSLANIRAATQCLRVVGSVDHKKGDFHGSKYTEIVPDRSMKSPGEIVMAEHMKKDVHVLLKCLDSRERQVLVLRFGLNDNQPKSLGEIGKIFHVSREWIRQIEKKAMEKLRDEETCKNMSYYLDL
ncbi:RNA polymerase sigma factor sigC isoform X2 [Tripterygium wilfordii]|nr:RNA polymerase sigma factor sigC isoform X2 [Tripterygium wilfordii]